MRPSRTIAVFLFGFGIPSFVMALTPLVLQGTGRKVDTATLERLRVANAIMPSCKNAVLLNLNFEGSVGDVPEAKIGASL